MRISFATAPLALVLLLTVSACERKISNTVVTVVDSLRHYHPIVQGQELDIAYRIRNVGAEPLIIEDIQPSCGCIVVGQDAERMVPPGGETMLRLTYNSTKNIGAVRQSIRLYGNIHPGGMALLQFDVNVVPDADYTRDYEELYRERAATSSTVEDVVNGKPVKKGYYTDSTFTVRKQKW